MSRYLVMVLVVGMLAGCGAAPTEVEVLEPGGMWDMKDDCVLGGFEAVVEAHTEAILLGDKCLNVEYGVEYYRVALVDDGREGWISGAILSSRNEPLVPLTATVAPTAPPTTPLIVTACMDQCIDLLTLNLDGAIPHDYELELAFSPGQEVGVRCVDGQTEERWVYVNTASHYRDNIACWRIYRRPGGGVRWHGHPSIFTVTVTWDDNQIVQRFEPAYEQFCTCGRCCYAGGISITIPISP